MKEVIAIKPYWACSFPLYLLFWYLPFEGYCTGLLSHCTQCGGNNLQSFIYLVLFFFFILYQFCFPFIFLDVFTGYRGESILITISKSSVKIVLENTGVLICDHYIENISFASGGEKVAVSPS